MRLSQEFFTRNTLEVARDLLGQILIHRSGDAVTSGIIVETEAYLGRRDPAAHSYKGATHRTRAMFGKKGCAYIYFIYGIYYCMNITTGPIGEPEAVLIRALEPVAGIDIMKIHRKTEKIGNLCNGPGKLCMAMDIDKRLYGTDLVQDENFYLESGEKIREVSQLKRINIDYAGEAKNYPWRFLAL